MEHYLIISIAQVDNGCIEHLFPSLYQEDWDVLIAHFLGVVRLSIFFLTSSKLLDRYCITCFLVYSIDMYMYIYFISSHKDVLCIILP